MTIPAPRRPCDPGVPPVLSSQSPTSDPQESPDPSARRACGRGAASGPESLGRHDLHVADCIDVMRGLPDASVDAVVTDPPYGLGFMGKAWDALPPGEEWAREVLRVLKPGGHLVAFGGTRTVHRLTCAIEDAGFEIRDQVGWVYFSGFPKSLDVSKAIDAAAGAEREVVAVSNNGCHNTSASMHKHDGGGLAASRVPVFNITAPATDEARRWEGWGTALKPAIEPAVLARKPLIGTVAANVLEHGTGALNIDACRFGYGDPCWIGPSEMGDNVPYADPGKRSGVVGRDLGFSTNSAEKMHAAQSASIDRMRNLGRWPANLYHCPKPSTAEREAGCEGLRQASAGELTGGRAEGSAALDCPRTGAGRTSSGRGNTHATVKPIALMRWLVRLVTPPGGTVLEPFAGSGTTLLACELEGARCIAIEREPEYAEIIRARYVAREVLRAMQSGTTPDAKDREAILRQRSLFGEVTP